MDEVIVYQKAGKSRAFESKVDGIQIDLDFVRSTTGRLDFSVSIDEELKGNNEIKNII